MEEDSVKNAELKAKRICRFCLTQDEPLSNIYSNENRLNSRAPLPLQIMACVSIEVFTNDGMPCTICDQCRQIMDYSYRFKQMCKKADTCLKQYPLTGQWPLKLEIPKFPEQLFCAQRSPVKPIKNLNHSSPPNKRPRIESKKVNQDQFALPVAPQKLPIKGVLLNKDAPVPGTTGSTKNLKILNKMPVKPVKVLNKDANLVTKKPIKILNKNAPSNMSNTNKNNNSIQHESIELSHPIVTSGNGKIEFITEIIPNTVAAGHDIVKVEQIQMLSKPLILSLVPPATKPIATTPVKSIVDPVLTATPVETDVFPCQHCQRSFPLRQLLNIHMKNHERERNFPCELCERCFFSKYDLGKHMLTHTGEKPFKCVVCNKAFSRSTLLYRHEKIHTNEPKFLCGHCDRPFLSEAELKRHSVRHYKNRPFSCHYCDKSFAFKQGLERHETVHSQEQPFKCDHCSKGFPTATKLTRHLTAHAGQRPYPCRLCPKSYLLSHHLSRHLRSHKNSTSIFKCSLCDSDFNTRDDLCYHSAVHATETLICPLCKESYPDIDAVTDHIRSHTIGEQFACVFCDLIFTTEEKLQYHNDLEHTDEEYPDDQNTGTNGTRTATIVKTEIITDPHENDIEDDMEIDHEITPNSYDDRSVKNVNADEEGGKSGLNIYDVDDDDDNDNDDDDDDDDDDEDDDDDDDDEDYREEFVYTYEDDIDKNIDKELQNIVDNEQKILNEESELSRKYAKLVKDTKSEVEDEQNNGRKKNIPVEQPQSSKLSKLKRKSDQDELDEEIKSKVSRTSNTIINSEPKVYKRITKITKQKISPEKPSTSAAAAAVATVATGSPTSADEKSDDGNSKSVTKQKESQSKITSYMKNTRENNKNCDKSPENTTTKLLNKLPKGMLVKRKSSPSLTVTRTTGNTTAIASKQESPNLKTPSSASKPKTIDNNVVRITSTVAKTTSSSTTTTTTAEATEKTPIKSYVKRKPETKITEMKIGDKMVKVQKILMTKSEVASMAKMGKIEMKGGQMILKQNQIAQQKTLPKTTTTTATSPSPSTSSPSSTSSSPESSTASVTITTPTKSTTLTRSAKRAITSANNANE